jgi:hypothetical protein
VLKHPSAHRLRVAVPHDEECNHFLLVVAPHIGVIERDFWDFARRPLRPEVGRRVPPALDALVTPRPEREVGGRMRVALGLRRGAWVASRPRSPRFFGGVRGLVVRLLSVPRRRLSFRRLGVVINIVGSYGVKLPVSYRRTRASRQRRAAQAPCLRKGAGTTSSAMNILRM